jgi:hypothetical protein
VIDHLEGIFRLTPLEIVASVLMRYPHVDGAAKKILNSYDEFIGILSDAEARAHLEQLTEADADADEIYQRARSLSHTFRDGLHDFFFDPKSEMDELTKNYGVF